MATVVAHHQSAFWPRRPEQNMQSFSMAQYLPTYGQQPRLNPVPQANTGYQQYQPHQPHQSHQQQNHHHHQHQHHHQTTPTSMYHHAPVVTSVPFQSGTYPLDHMSMNAYAMQPNFNHIGQVNPVNYQHSLAHSQPQRHQQFPASSGITVDLPIMRNANNITSASSPVVKSEVGSPTQSLQPFNDSEHSEDIKTEGGKVFKTDVDTLMKTIQGKSKNPESESTPSHRPEPVPSSNTSTRKKAGEKRFICTFEDCNKPFQQKTHLLIHIRSHTGHRPFQCDVAGCGKTFSQMGNLRTHARRHTGERPYPCEICGKTFAQRGNVRAHKIVHDNVKPFTCRLDECGKTFTQLGNLKSHQNKFHASTLQYLTAKFKSSTLSPNEKELFDHFLDLYKNSNKGIPGRGKDRRITPFNLNESSTHSTTQSERGSSLSTDTDMQDNGAGGFSFNTPVNGQYVDYQAQHGYADGVFPERKPF